MPASVVEFVARARSRRNLRSALESLALGIAAALIALAACRLSPFPNAEDAVSPLALAVCGALSGLAMAGTWWVERAKKTDQDLARQIDARLERDGALATAYEARVQGNVSALVRVLEGRVSAGLDRESLRRALPALGFIWLAPPACGAALLALVLELPAQRSADSGAAQGATAAAAMSGSRAAAVAKATLDRARLQSSASGIDAALRARLIAELDAAAADIRAALPQISSAGATADSAARLLTELQAERSALAADGSVHPSDPHTPSGGARGVAPGSGAGVESGSGAEADKSLLTNGSSDRTMSGSNRPTAATDGARSTPPSPESGSPGEVGTLAGRWWDERYDPVVQGWRRALAARREH